MGFQVVGGDQDAIDALDEFLGQLQGIELDENPFRNTKHVILVVVQQVSAGIPWLRGRTFGLFGRRSIRVRLMVQEGENIVCDEQLTASTLLLDERDVGIFDGPWSAHRTHQRTNCRKLAKQIVRTVSSRLGLPYGMDEVLLAALSKGKNEWGLVVCLIAVSFLCGTTSAFLFWLNAQANDKQIAAILGFAVGAAVGLVGTLLLAIIIQLFGKLLGR